MGRIGDALKKLKLNANASGKPFGKMNVKETIKLFYHLAEVYDAEALMPETTVKKQLQRFKNFARVHSLIHLLPSPKDMKSRKKCSRMINSLLDMLETKHGADLYTRKSWPKACKEIPKIETPVISTGAYNFDGMSLDANALPPGAPEVVGKAKVFPGEKIGAKVAVESIGISGDKTGDTSASTTQKDNTTAIKAPPNVSIAAELHISPTERTGSGVSIKPANLVSPTDKIAEPEESKAVSVEKSKEDSEEESFKNKTNPIEQPNHKKRSRESSVPSSGSKANLKKSKTEHNARDVFVEALEDLSKVRPIVEVIGWSKAIFTNHRIWLILRDLIFNRILLGKELRKYQTKKLEGAAGTKVTVEKIVSQEDVKTLKSKLRELMIQIKNAVPEQLSEELKCAVNSSCENVTLVFKDPVEW